MSPQQQPLSAAKPQSLPMSVGLRAGLGVYILALAGVIFFFLVTMWPRNAAAPAETTAFPWGVYTFPIDTRYMLIAALAGALGAYVHLATSFADFAGNEKLVKSWAWWYVLRPGIGAALAEIFYLVLRGGFVTGSNTLSPHGVAALSALTGMFSRQATDKLRELCENLFRLDKQVERKDPLPAKATPTPAQPSTTTTEPRP
jgi:hypothetical protein